MILYFVPLGGLPLPTVITIFFVSPLLITLLSVPFLGERIGVHRHAIGMHGPDRRVVSHSPRNADFQIEAVVVFGAALSYGSLPDLDAPPEIGGQPVGHGDGLAALLHHRLLPILVNYFMPRAASDNATLDFLFRAGDAGDAGCRFPCFCTAAVLFLSMASSNAYRSIEASMIAPSNTQPSRLP